jgi:hypothetical protein
VPVVKASPPPVYKGPDPRYDTCMNEKIDMTKSNLVGVRRTYADFFGAVKKVEHIGPYFADERFGHEQMDICELTRRADMRMGRNVDGFPVVKWEIVQWDESLRGR